MGHTYPSATCRTLQPAIVHMAHCGSFEFTTGGVMPSEFMELHKALHSIPSREYSIAIVPIVSSHSMVATQRSYHYQVHG